METRTNRLMKHSCFVAFKIIVFIHLTLAWDTTFKYNQCYNKPMDERMPLSIDNLIAIVERYERNERNTASDIMADGLLYRYRINGVIFKPKSQPEWSVYQTEESTKQDLDDQLLKSSFDFPENSFFLREECSLHMMISHSIDDFPHAGVATTWENELYRKKRQSGWDDSKTSDNTNDWGSSRSRSYSSSRSESNSNQEYSNYKSQSGAYLPDESDVTQHPIEFGVIQTTSGPVATGLLLAGIMSKESTETYTVEELVGSENAKSYMSQEMAEKSIEILFGSTISGELGQAALLAGMRKREKFEVGPFGIFGNCSACARIFSLESPYYFQLTRAEINGAIDGLIVAEYLREKGSSQSISLSEILRMYYSDHGLFNFEIRACNRKNIFRKFQNNYKAKMYDQALNYMYAYQNYIPSISTVVAQYQDDFQRIETVFRSYLDPVVKAFADYMTSSSFDEAGSNKCRFILENEVLSETEVDLVVVYSPTGDVFDMEKQTQYIALTARYLGVGYDRSRIAVLNGRKNEWLSPMTNYSNVADYACNHTTYIDYSGGSSENFVNVLDQLAVVYEEYYGGIRADSERVGRHSQVVLWNLPDNFDGDEEEMIDSWDEFNATYPDVTFVFVGTKEGQLNLFYNSERENEDELILVNNSPPDPDEIAKNIVEVVQKAPRMFVYPSCSLYEEDEDDDRDTKNTELDKSENGGVHTYSVYVSPNFTTYIRIPPQNFLFSETLTLLFKDSDVFVCVSRESREPSSDDDEDITSCGEAGSFEYETMYLCDYVWEHCNPIYISVKGNPDSKRSCTDDECHFPNQIEFEMKHRGMNCGVWGLVPTPLLLPTFFILFLF